MSTEETVNSLKEIALVDLKFHLLENVGACFANLDLAFKAECFALSRIANV